jgi:hypothetical protein
LFLVSYGDLTDSAGFFSDPLEITTFFQDEGWVRVSNPTTIVWSSSVSSRVPGVDAARPRIPGAGLVIGPSEPTLILRVDSREDHFLHGSTLVEKPLCGSLGLSSGGQCSAGASVPKGGLLRSDISGHRLVSGASGSTSPLYFSEEVHTILRDFVTEPIQERGFSA